ncbi:MAG: hypothetical protein U1E51_21715, partial [Candidatus Binatia bacterium]|nr:hypothetical protein [Candidatus Binatia bacterium]
NKARQQPDKVRMVLDKVRTDGLMPTIASVRNKLDQPLTLGYCNVGVASNKKKGDAALFPYGGSKEQRAGSTEHGAGSKGVGEKSGDDKGIGR